MRVEIRDHAADGGGDEVVVLDPVHVVALHALDDLGEQARLLPGKRIGRGTLVCKHRGGH